MKKKILLGAVAFAAVLTLGSYKIGHSVAAFDPVDPMAVHNTTI